MPPRGPIFYSIKRVTMQALSEPDQGWYGTREVVYDSGDYPTSLRRAAELGD